MSPDEVRRLRLRNDWSLQDLANASGINKAYLSEFENGKRKLPDESLSQLTEALLRVGPAGHTRPELVADENGYPRLHLVNQIGERFIPDVAHVKWTESDGTTYTMFVGKRELGALLYFYQKW